MLYCCGCSFLSYRYLINVQVVFLGVSKKQLLIRPIIRSSFRLPPAVQLPPPLRPSPSIPPSHHPPQRLFTQLCHESPRANLIDPLSSSKLRFALPFLQLVLDGQQSFLPPTRQSLSNTWTAVSGDKRCLGGVKFDLQR